jgi:beta-glucosidase
MVPPFKHHKIFHIPDSTSTRELLSMISRLLTIDQLLQKMIKIAFLLVVALVAVNASLLSKRPYMPSYIIELIRNMTLEEKVRQMDLYNGASLIDRKTGKFSPEIAKQTLGSLGVGSVARLYPSTVELNNEMQAWVINSSRHKIPALRTDECLHGDRKIDSTVFPQSISMGVSEIVL